MTPDDWQEDVLESWLGRRRDGRWSAATCALAVPRQNGKNGIIEIRELFGMVGLGERFLHTAHEVKTARKAFLRLASFFENERQYPELAVLRKEIRKTNGQEAIVLTNGASCEFVARSKGSGRGFSVDVLVCDEAQDLTDEELAALLPTISAAPTGNPQVILTGTPPDPEKPEAAQGEVFRRVRNDGETGRDPRLAWTDYGAPDGPLPDVTDRALWPAWNPALGTRLHVNEVERELRLMSREKFAVERAGWWGDPASARVSVLPRWHACRLGDDLPPTEGLAVAVAVSVDQAWSSVAAAARWSDGRIHVGPVLAADGSVDRRPGTSWVPARLKELQDKHGCPVLLDEKGPADHLAEQIEAAGVALTTLSTEDVLNACSSFFNDVRDGQLTHFGHPVLEAAVAGAAKRSVVDRWAWGRKSSRSDVSMLEAATLAAVGTRSAYDVLDSVI